MDSSENLLPQQNLKDYVLVILRRKWTVIGTFAVAVAIGATMTAMTTPLYRASATLLVAATEKAPAIRTGNPLMDVQALTQPPSMRMQLMVLESGPFMANVLQKITPPPGAQILSTSAADGSFPGLIDLTVVSTHPRLAAQVAQTMAEEYLNYSRDTSLNELRDAKKFIASERTRTQEELEKAEGALLAFKRRLHTPELASEQDQRSRQVLSLEDRLEENTNGMARITAQITELQFQIAREPASISQSLDRPNPRRGALEVKLADLEMQRGVMQLEYKESAPQIVSIDAQIQRVKQRMEAEPEMLETHQKLPNPARSQLNARLQDLDFQLRGLRAERGQLLIRVADERARASALLPQEVQLTTLTANRDAARRRFVTVDEKLQDLDLREKQWSPTARVFEAAEVPRAPFTPRRRANLMVSAILGLVLGLGIVFLLESLDDRITTPEEVEREIGLPVLAYLPLIPSRHSLLMTGMPSRSPVAESYRALRSSINFAAVDHPLRTIVVSSSEKSEGKSVTATNLGIAMAMDGRQVILVDTDLRRPTIHRMLKREMGPGLTDVLMGTNTLEETLGEFPDVPNLRVMTCGDMPPNPAELLNSSQMEELVGRLREVADVVIFDCPPTLPVTDATLLSTKVDAVLLVAAVGKVRRGGLKYTKEQFDRARARVLGVVFNKVNGNLSSSYPYYDRRYYEEDRRRTLRGVNGARANGKSLGGRVRALVGRSERSEWRGRSVDEE